MATKIISIEQGKKGSSMVKFETPNGDVYVAGFLSLMPCKLPEYYSKTICAIVDKWATLEDVDLFSFLSQKLIVNGYLIISWILNGSFLPFNTQNAILRKNSSTKL